MILKIDGVTHGQLAQLAQALQSDLNVREGLQVSRLVEVKPGDELGFKVTVEVSDKLPTGEKKWHGSNTYSVQGGAPRKYVNLIFDAVEIFPEADKPVEIE